MKKEFKPGMFARFPNEQIPHILEILKANGHPVWSSVVAWQDHHDIVFCSSDNDMMGYDSTEPQCRTEMTPHDFMTITLRLEEGMGIHLEDSSLGQRKHIAEEMERLGIKQTVSTKERGETKYAGSFLFSAGEWKMTMAEVKNRIPYLEFCRRLCVEPIEKTLEQHADEYDAGKFDPMKPMQAFTPGAMWFDVKPENFVGFHKGYPVFWNESLHSYESYLDVRNVPEVTAAMLEVGEWMEITEVGPHENWVVQKMENTHFLYCPEYAEVIVDDTIRGKKVKVEIKVVE